MSIPHVFDFVPQSQADLDRYVFIDDKEGANATTSFVTNPDTGLQHGCYKVMKQVVTATGTFASRAVRLRAMESGGFVERNTDFDFWEGVFAEPKAGIRQQHTGSYYIQTRFMYQKGSTGTFDTAGARAVIPFRVFAGSSGAINASPSMQIRVVNIGGTKHAGVYLNDVATEHIGTAAECEEDTTYDMRIRYKPASSSPGSDGILQAWIKEADSDSFTQILDIDDHDQESDVHWLDWCLAATNVNLTLGDGLKVWHMGAYARTDGFEADDYEYFRVMCQCFDVSQTTAKIMVHVTDDMVDTTSGGFRVEYSTDPDFGTYESTGYVAYAGRSSINTDHFEVTGLTAGTGYYYRARFVDNTSSPTAEYVSDVRRFKTLRTVGQAGTTRWVTFSCNHDEGFAGNNEAIRSMLAAESAADPSPFFLDFSLWLGDTFYEDWSSKLNTGNSDYYLWPMIESEYYQAYIRAFEEYDNNSLLRAAACIQHHDDHEIFNSIDGNARGNSDAMGVAEDVAGNLYPTVPLDPDYLSGGSNELTAGEVFDLTTAVMYKWWGESTIGAANAATADYYRAIETGKTLIPILDTRTRTTVTALLNSTQEQWLKDTISGSSARYVFLASPSTWRDDIAHPHPENWGSNGDYRAQREGIFDWCEANAADRVIYGFGGDRHAWYMGTFTGDAIDSCLKYEINPCPAKAPRWYSGDVDALASEPTIVAAIDTDDYGENAFVRTSGAVVEINEATGQVDVRMYDDYGTLLMNQSDTYPPSAGGGGNTSRNLIAIRRRRR